MKKRPLAAAALALAVASAAPDAHAQYMRTGYNTTAVARGDDNLASSVLGFNVNYFGVTTSTAVACMNGYVIMGNFAPASPCAYPGTLAANPPATPNVTGLRTFYGQVIAPFFSDISTDFAGTPGGQLFFGTQTLNGAATWAATWNAVRGYGGGSGTTGAASTFQLFMGSLGNGNFIMEFNYGALGFGAEGGIGYADDGGATGTAFLKTVAAASTTAPIAPANQRYCARFVGGALAAEALNTDCLAQQFTVGTVPEPTTVVMLAAGLLALAGAARARSRRRVDA